MSDAQSRPRRRQWLTIAWLAFAVLTLLAIADLVHLLGLEASLRQLTP